MRDATSHAVTDAVEFPCPYCRAVITAARVDGLDDVLMHRLPACARFLTAEADVVLLDVLAMLRRREN